MKTAMTRLIEILKEEKASDECITSALAFLDLERKQIMDAYENGFEDGQEDPKASIYFEAEHYYFRNYK